MGIIITKWLHATETKHDRVKATTGSGKSVTVSAYSHEGAVKEAIRKFYLEDPDPDHYILVKQAHDKVPGYIWCVFHLDSLKYLGFPGR